MVMEICHRGSLYNVLKDDKTLVMTWDRFFSFALDCIYGIKTLHKWDPQILHRDIKTLNFLVNKDLAVKVCDFGLSRFNTPNNMVTMNKIVGTVHYLGNSIF